jgi:hypothetical protein
VIWKRALPFDKRYVPALNNLAALPKVREVDDPNILRQAMLDPLGGIRREK